MEEMLFTCGPQEPTGHRNNELLLSVFFFLLRQNFLVWNTVFAPQVFEQSLSLFPNSVTHKEPVYNIGKRSRTSLFYNFNKDQQNFTVPT